ncbi:hypothetical protein ACIPMZ_16740 [Scandinavium goeteborgense]|uniref:hypothetical protein n=1 Tax=Scandinavium goeteborgense TaxID=1851514 RepID=UPI0038255511
MPSAANNMPPAAELPVSVATVASPAAASTPVKPAATSKAVNSGVAEVKTPLADNLLTSPVWASEKTMMQEKPAKTGKETSTPPVGFSLDSEEQKRAYASGIGLAHYIDDQIAQQKMLHITLNRDNLLSGIMDTFLHQQKMSYIETDIAIWLPHDLSSPSSNVVLKTKLI